MENRAYVRRVLLPYRIALTVAALAFVGTMLANVIFTFVDSLAFGAALIVGCLLFELLLNRIWRMYTLLLVVQRGDLRRFLAITASVRKSVTGATAFWCATACYYGGEYQQTADICAAVIRDPKNKRMAFYRYYAGACFETGSVNALRRVCDDFEAFRSRAGRRADELYSPVMELYRLFANGEYEALKQAYEGIDPSRYNRATAQSCAYVRGVTAYALGELDEALTYFEGVAKAVPTLGVGKLAVHMCEAIGRGEAYAPAAEELAPTEGYELPRTDKRMAIALAVRRVLRVVLVVCMALLIALEGVLVYLEKKSQAEYEQAVAAYRTELTEALTAEYGDVEIVEYFNLTENGEILETVCVFQRADGRFGAAFYFTYTDTDTNAVQLIMNGIDAESSMTISWYVNGPCCYRAVWFRIYDTPDAIPESVLHTTSVTEGNSTLYFCVTEIEP